MTTGHVEPIVFELADADEGEYRILAGRREVTATSPGGALAAARQLVIDAAEMGGSSTLLRKDIIILENGIYNGRLTEAAKSGRSSCE